MKYRLIFRVSRIVCSFWHFDVLVFRPNETIANYRRNQPSSDLPPSCTISLCYISGQCIGNEAFAVIIHVSLLVCDSIWLKTATAKFAETYDNVIFVALQAIPPLSMTSSIDWFYIEFLAIILRSSWSLLMFLRVKINSKTRNKCELGLL